MLVFKAINPVPVFNPSPAGVALYVPSPVQEFVGETLFNAWQNGPPAYDKVTGVSAFTVIVPVAFTLPQPPVSGME